LKQVPVATDLARSDADRQALALFFARVELGRPLVLPPGVPAERVTLLRKALRDTLNDPAFRDDARRQDLHLNYISGEELLATIAAAYHTPKAVIQRTIQALGRAWRP
jgi:tripartite-type tricarboxylate transporter receptor subunit TctC